METNCGTVPPGAPSVFRLDASPTPCLPGKTMDEPRPEALAADQRIGPMVAQLVICFVVPVLGPMLTIVRGFLWLDPAQVATRRRDGKILLVFGLICFALSLLILMLQFVGLIQLLQSGGLGAR